MAQDQERTALSGVCVEPGLFRLEPRPVPRDAPDGWVLIDIAAVGLCGTDFHIFEGKHPFLDYPRVIGHELSGVVARSAAGWEAGRLVVVNPYISCGECRACARGKANCCVRIAVLGVHRDGGLCGRIAVPAGNLYAADGLTPHLAAMVEFLAIGAHAVRRSGVGPGDVALVTGAGPIGLGAALFARLAGAEVHLRDASPARLALARDRFGFTALHGVAEPLLTGALAEGFDVVFDATGAAPAIEAGFAHVAHGGTYVLISVVKGEITFTDAEFHKREMRLVASRNAVAEDFRAVIDALTTGRIDGARLLSEALPLDRLAARFPQLVRERDGLIKVVVDVAAAAGEIAA